MTDRWNRIETLFDRALDEPLERRVEWLHAVCDDSEIRKEVLDLLEANASAEGFLETPAGLFASDLIHAERAEQIGRLGQYSVLREIGRGGMGAVYLARRTDGQYQQQVAIKMLRSGVANESLIHRFVTERQILATLSHPNIGRLIDGGVAVSGAQYLVMEYIDGMAIDRYCDEHARTIDERLKLFLVVCDAVSYAHRRLIVHRDLKPSNILVTKDGSVKLLDFGIAKMLQPDDLGGTTVTNTGQFLLTPEYASPEQVRGLPVSIASDVYQLGLLLYRLLTGSLPHRFTNRSLTDIAHVVCEQEAPRPSSVIGREETPTPSPSSPVRRARRLRGDLDAIVLKALRKEPEDRYESVDRLADDIRLHLRGLPVAAHAGSVFHRVGKFVRRNRWQVAAASLFLALLAGYAVTTTMEKNRTTRERDRATRYATFLTDLFGSPNPFEKSSPANARELTVREFLDTGVKRLHSELADDEEMQASLLGTIADVYEGLGYPDKARALYQEMLAFSKKENGEHSPETVEILRRLSWVTTDSTVADSLFDLQLRLARELEGGTGPIAARSLVRYGKWLADNGRLLDGDEALGRAVAILRRSVPGNTESLIGALLFSAEVKTSLNLLAEADTLANEAYQLRRTTRGENHPSTAVALIQLAATAEMRGDMERAEQLKRQTLRIFEESLGDHHTYTLSAANNLAVLLARTSRYDEAVEIARNVLALREKYFGDNDSETVGALQNLATYLLRQGRLEEAAPMFEEAYSRFKAILPAGHQQIAFPLLSLADVYLQEGKFHEAESCAREAMGRLSAALPEKHPLTAVAASRLGEALSKQGRYAEAEPLLLDSYATLIGSHGFDPHRARARARLVSLYLAWGRPADAARFEYTVQDEQPPSGE